MVFRFQIWDFKGPIDRQKIPINRNVSISDFLFCLCQGLNKYGCQYCQNLKVYQLGCIAIKKQRSPGRKFIVLVVENELKRDGGGANQKSG